MVTSNVSATPPLPSSRTSKSPARHLIWIIPVGCVGITAAILLFIGAIFIFVFSLIKDSPVYEGALDRAAEHPDVIEMTGDPLEPGWFVSGNIAVNNQTGNADLSIPVSGPDGSGQLQVEATKSGGEWQYDSLNFFDESGGPPIDLLHER